MVSVAGTFPIAEEGDQILLGAWITVHFNFVAGEIGSRSVAYFAFFKKSPLSGVWLRPIFC